MGGLVYPRPLLSLTSLNEIHKLSAPIHLPRPFLLPKSSSKPIRAVNFGKKTLNLVRKSSERNGNNGGDEFMDENGGVEDMEGYLNSLSLEYDSVWDTKPSWCQPWTITLTGASVIACSWLILHSVLVTLLVSFLIGAWWYIFLYSYPKAYTEMIAERRKRVTTGLEDTYGVTKSS